MPNATDKQKLLKLAKRVVAVLETKCKRGNQASTWIGYENGSGVECGYDIEALIQNAKRHIKKLEQPA